MKVRWVFLICFAVVLAIPPSAGGQQCSDCDCSHFPIPKKCESCCGLATGNISSVTNSNLVLSQREPNGGTVKKMYSLRPDTKKNAVLKEGAPATVYYQTKENVATRVDLVEAIEGLLVPGNGADPPLPPMCSDVPPSALKVFLGDSLGFTSADEVTVLRIRGVDVLRLHRTSAGIAVLAKVFSEDGKIFAQVVDNHLYVNPDNFFRVDNPDSHSFVVYDLHQKEMLGISYIGPHSLRVWGIFQLPGSVPVIINQTELLIGSSHFFRSCSGNAAVLFAIQ
jgi:hypothetical protein